MRRSLELEPTLLVTLTLALAAACSPRAAPACTTHPSLDDARELALGLNLLSTEERTALAALEVCAIPGAEPVLAGTRAIVDTHASQHLLAAQLVHLAVHASVPEAARCGDVAADERRAYALEDAARARLELPPVDPLRETRAVTEREARCARDAPSPR